MIKKISFLLFFCGCFFSGYGQNGKPDLYVHPDFHAFQLYPVGQPQHVAAIPLGEAKALQLSYDDLSANTLPLNYTWIHCDRYWTPSTLLASEYLEGFLEGQTAQGLLSFNTYQPYSHVSMTLPEASCMPRVSGNYYLVLYESDPKEYLAKYPVVIYENLVGIQTSIHRTAPIELMKTHQEIDALADLTNFSVQNPLEDVQWSVLQNRDWTSLKSFKPRFLRNGYYDFDYNGGENAFPGNTIFRFVDSKNIPVPTLRIPRYELLDLWHAFVLEERPRGFEPFVNQDDARGAFVPRKQSANSDLEADYILLDIAVEDIEKSGHRALYVVGDFNHYQRKEEFQLIYDAEAGQYVGQIFIKQGYLEYHLAEWNGDTQQWDYSFTEGNHWNCPNEYTSFLYLREWGQRFDRVIGFGQTFTNGMLGINVQISTP